MYKVELDTIIRWYNNGRFFCTQHNLVLLPLLQPLFIENIIKHKEETGVNAVFFWVSDIINFKGVSNQVVIHKFEFSMSKNESNG